MFSLLSLGILKTILMCIPPFLLSLLFFFQLFLPLSVGVTWKVKPMKFIKQFMKLKNTWICSQKRKISCALCSEGYYSLKEELGPHDHGAKGTVAPETQSTCFGQPCHACLPTFT